MLPEQWVPPRLPGQASVLPLTRMGDSILYIPQGTEGPATTLPDASQWRPHLALLVLGSVRGGCSQTASGRVSSVPISTVTRGPPFPGPAFPGGAWGQGQVLDFFILPGSCLLLFYYFYFCFLHVCIS